MRTSDCGSQTIRVFEDEECLYAPHMHVLSLTAGAAEALASNCSVLGNFLIRAALDPSGAGEQHWVPLLKSITDVPISDSSHVSLNFCARLRQRLL